MHCHDFDLMKGPQSVFCSLGLLTLQGTLKHRHTTLVTSQRRTVQKRAGSKTCLVLAAACQPPYRFVDCLTTQASPILRGSQISKPSSRVFQETWSVSTFFGVDRPSGRYSPAIGRMLTVAQHGSPYDAILEEVNVYLLLEVLIQLPCKPGK